MKHEQILVSDELLLLLYRVSQVAYLQDYPFRFNEMGNLRSKNNLYVSINEYAIDEMIIDCYYILHKFDISKDMRNILYEQIELIFKLPIWMK